MPEVNNPNRSRRAVRLICRHPRNRRRRHSALKILLPFLRDDDDAWDEFIRARPVARWTSLHARCRPPYHRAERYFISMLDITTRGDLIGWSNHLVERHPEWIFDTDWDTLIRDAVKLCGPRLFLLPSLEELDEAARRHGFSDFEAVRQS